MLKLSQNIINDLEEKKVEKIKIFFYTSWCAWTKIDLVENDFEINEDLVCLEKFYNFDIYIEKKDFEKLDNSIITRLEVKKNEENEHLKWKKYKYIFTNEKIKERCGCWTSFSFEKKKPKIDLEKLKNLKNKF